MMTNLVHIINSIPVDGPSSDYHISKYVEEKGDHWEDWEQSLILFKSKDDGYTTADTKYFDGLIFDTQSKEIVYYGLDKMILDTKTVPEDLQPVGRQELLDGTRIGAYYYQGEWRFSTPKCINAKRSYFYQFKTFYEYLMDIFKQLNFDYQQVLDKDYYYTFVLCHPENRIVKGYDQPSLTLVHMRNRNSLEAVKLEVPGLAWVKEVETDDEYGSILVLSDGRRVKNETEFYKKLKEIKGNRRNLSIRCLELMRDKLSNEQWKLLIANFPEFSEIYDTICHDFNYLARHIQTIYYYKHVKKTSQFINPFLVKFVYELHGDFIRTRNQITPEVVHDKLVNSDLERQIFLLRNLIPNSIY